MNILEKIEHYRALDYDITIGPVAGSVWIETDPEDRPYNVSVYYGDTNAPWKEGTLQGVGNGYTIEEAFDNAILDLKTPIIKAHWWK